MFQTPKLILNGAEVHGALLKFISHSVNNLIIKNGLSSEIYNQFLHIKQNNFYYARRSFNGKI
jgi:hypothetical protein